ncbi:MAG: hypothetical protein VKL60_12125 [Sphaerospermopsis sp.]|nr:hypothetical protein [Sphaerospermopsis sp.]
MDEKSYLDSLERDSINQLHAAVLQVSQACYDIKKLCATIISSAAGAALGLAKVQAGVAIDYPFFIVGAAVSAFFWFLDGQNYLLQIRMRLRMKELADNIAKRNGLMFIVDGVGMPIVPKSKQPNLILKAAFNNSMIFYYLLVSIFVSIAILQILKVLPIIVVKKIP